MNLHRKVDRFVSKRGSPSFVFIDNYKMAYFPESKKVLTSCMQAKLCLLFLNTFQTEAFQNNERDRN